MKQKNKSSLVDRLTEWSSRRISYISAVTAIFGVVLLGMMVLFLIFVGSFNDASAQTVTVTKSIELPSPEERAMISLTNDYRVAAGLIDLTTNSQLMASAQAKVDDLCQAGNWAHTDSRGREFQGFIKDSGYKYDEAGENLARGQVDQPAAFLALLNSPSHLENIVGKYREIGVGFNDCDGKRYTVVHYGVRL